MICMKLSTRASSSFLCVCSLERNAGKVYALLFCTLHVLRTNLILAIDSLSDFPPKTFYFEIFPKTNAVSITLGLRYIHGQSLKELISDPKRSGPVFWETLS